MRSVLACAGLLALGAVGCTGNGIPPASQPDLGSPDLGPHDGGTRVDGDVGPTPDMGHAPDAPGMDAFGSDAFGIDAPGIDAPGTDTGVPVDSPDLGPRPDTSACRLVDGAFDLCACGTFGASCATTACPSGQTCTSDPCGMHCVPAGSACVTVADCPAGDTCTSGVCSHTGSTCHDSRDCPLGFACESGACVDRRIPCSPDGNCPYGYACYAALDHGTCVRLSRPCDTDAACTSTLGAQQVCTDINGDGTFECQFAGGPCRTNLDCTAAGSVCTPHALTDLSVCGRFGPCLTANDCAPGLACRDLWGDGVPECVQSGGCTNSAACPAHQVCATPATGGAPMCLSSG